MLQVLRVKHKSNNCAEILTHTCLRGAGKGGGRVQREGQRVGHIQYGMRVSPLSFVLRFLLHLGGTAETTHV